MPSSENKVHRKDRERLTRPRTSRVAKTLAIEKESTVRTDKKRQEEQAMEENCVDGQTDPILYWTKTGHWPKGYTEQSDKNTSHLLARQKSSGSLRRRKSPLVSVDPASVATSSVAPSSTTPSDQKPRDVKSAPYQDPRYETLLTTKGSFIIISDLDVDEGNKTLCRSLLQKEQTVHEQSLFRDDLFEQTIQKIQNRNEARVIQDISRLIVPSAEALTSYGAKHLKFLIESVNEGWNNSFPLTGMRPQPDYSVGFKREASTSEQLNKLASFIGNFISSDHSYLMATYYMYFPFFTCEVKCGAAALDIADRQHAYSIILAVRATVELFRLVGREMKLHREILAFSISHNHRLFSFTPLNGKEKWTAYKFTKNIYDIWMPNHFKRLCSAIDQIPVDLDFSVAQPSKSFGLSEDLQGHNLSGSSQPDSQSYGNSQQSTSSGARDSTPNTSFTDRGTPKRPRKRLAEGQQSKTRVEGKRLAGQKDSNAAKKAKQGRGTQGVVKPTRPRSRSTLLEAGKTAMDKLEVAGGSLEEEVEVLAKQQTHATSEAKTGDRKEINLIASNDANTATANEAGPHRFLAIKSSSSP
ncbi:uncharacterized protein PV09_02952 [Verruconis gallopava]|uniref:DUF7924 domain-containing protein n=1 Tax=Verruconis gallopava TaxID=253628 RepID=A0A0D2AI46_9PEZI|nr:uncharacterized protein PV09_02952 [Verruconis gallopava]KIW06518.1 hypothetical protein PV09_02952 [Verruconis gallopava]